MAASHVARQGERQLSQKTRYWFLGAILLVAAVTGSIAWELINPVSMVYRGLVFGMGLTWCVVAAIFLLDLFVGRRAWVAIFVRSVRFTVCWVRSRYCVFPRYAVSNVTIAWTVLPSARNTT